MFSAFKKLTNKNDVSAGGGQNGEGVHSMSHNLQKKFAKGCNYNIKIVIRGDKNTGKSCLLNRLQGSKFREEYIPTEEIQVESINWSYKNTEDIVKVEVWDVVDVAKKRKKLTGLKVAGASETEDLEPGLDAQFLDVYKQSHGAILIFDITKPWTFDYVKAEVLRVPSSIPVLVLANFVDQDHHRQVTKLQIADFIENIQRPGNNPAEVRWSECSLRNGFGLRFLHNFFNIPFLTLQRESLLKQLEQNQREIQATHDELDLYMESESADYNKFSESLATRRRQAADNLAPAPTRSIIVGNSSSSAASTVPKIQESNSDLSYSNRSNTTTTTSTASGQLSEQQLPNAFMSSLSLAADTTDASLSKAKSTSLSPSNSSPGIVTGSMPAVSKTKDASNVPAPAANASTAPINFAANANGASKVDVENFMPDSGDFDNFLDDDNSGSSHNVKNGGTAIDTSDDEDGGNPMVSKFDEDVYFDEYDSAGNSAINMKGGAGDPVEPNCEEYETL